MHVDVHHVRDQLVEDEFDRSAVLFEVRRDFLRVRFATSGRRLRGALARQVTEDRGAARGLFAHELLRSRSAGAAADLHRVGVSHSS